VLPVVIRVVFLVPAVSVVSLVPAPTIAIAPGSAAKVDHRRRGIIMGRLIDHRRRRVFSIHERIDADTDTHLRACGRGSGKRKSGAD
jgi:hypothetical protein